MSKRIRISMILREELITRIDAAARRLGLTRSELIRAAVDRDLERRESDPCTVSLKDNLSG